MLKVTPHFKHTYHTHLALYHDLCTMTIHQPECVLRIGDVMSQHAAIQTPWDCWEAPAVLQSKTKSEFREELEELYVLFQARDPLKKRRCSLSPISWRSFTAAGLKTH